jgi:hypothetical protein
MYGRLRSVDGLLGTGPAPSVTTRRSKRLIMISGTTKRRTPERGSGFNARSAMERDLVLLQRAGPLIAELGDDLDGQLEHEARASERLRFLREATVRITRTANDAIQAYRRTRRFLDASVAGATGDGQEFAVMRTRLDADRQALLAVLDKAAARYPEARADSSITS